MFLVFSFLIFPPQDDQSNFVISLMWTVIKNVATIFFYEHLCFRVLRNVSKLLNISIYLYSVLEAGRYFLNILAAFCPPNRDLGLLLNKYLL